jgi:uncharacterized protein (TIGR02466 family)
MKFEDWFPTTIGIDDINGLELDLIQNEIKNSLPMMTASGLTSPWKDNVLTSFKYGQVSNVIDQYHLVNFRTKIISNILKMLNEYKLPARQASIEESWFNISGNNGFQFDHQHPFTDISGVYYYQTGNYDGDLVFINPNPYAATFNYSKGDTHQVRVTPVVGRMILFPGWLTHRVEVNHTYSERISFTFNIKLTY